MALRRSAYAVTTAAALAATLALGGCGSGGDSTTTSASATATWADGVCAATSVYKESLQAASSSVKSGGLSKSALQDAADNVKSATDTYVSSLQDLDSPETSAGKTAKTTVDHLVEALQHDAETIADASSGSALEAVSVVSTTLVTARDEVASAVDELEKVDAKGELKTAFETAPACVALKGASS
jgi:hypothetical protein